MSGDDQGGAGRREVAYRVFAAEYDDADFSYSESDEERAPNYVVLPTGARVNRLFVVGVLTEVEQASDEVLRARVVDPTGAFVVYAGQYQPEALAFLDRAEPPAFVAITGKARTFQPDDADRTYTSIRPETANEVDADTRDRWTVGAARQTLNRVGAAARALTYDERGDALRDRLESEGFDAGLAAGIPLAIDHYGTTATYLDAVRETALGTVAVVAGERDEVDPLDVRPDEEGPVDPASLVGPDHGGAAASAAGAASTDAAVDSDGPAGDAGTTTQATAGESAGTTAGATAPDAGEDPSDAPMGETNRGGSDGASADAAGGDGETAAGATDAGTGTASTGGDGLDDFEPGEFELDAEQREEIEQEYGTDFQTGTEVDDPGEADIDTPDPEVGGETGDDGDDAGVGGEAGDESGVAPGASAAAEEATADAAAQEDADAGAAESGEVDVEDAVMEAMRANDGGSGAARSDVVEAVVGDYGVSESAVEEAIQDALMDGRCYEPEDDVYKPI